MKDKKEIPKYHNCGNIKFYNGKLKSISSKTPAEKPREITEVRSFSDIHLINLNKVKNEKNYTHDVL